MTYAKRGLCISNRTDLFKRIKPGCLFPDPQLHDPGGAAGRQHCRAGALPAVVPGHRDPRLPRRSTNHGAGDRRLRSAALLALLHAGAVRRAALLALLHAGAVRRAALLALLHAGAVRRALLLALLHAGAARGAALLALLHAGAVRDAITSTQLSSLDEVFFSGITVVDFSLDFFFLTHHILLFDVSRGAILFFYLRFMTFR